MAISDTPRAKLGFPIGLQASISVSNETLDLGAVEQLVEHSQTRAIAAALSTLLRSAQP